jgi:hypothetical protein
MKALLLTILLSYSCTQKAHLSKDAMGLKLTEVQMEMSHLNEIDWLVGKNKEAKVSQSLIFVVDMPKVDDEDLEHLTKTKNIDGWILRLIVQRGSQSQDLGSLYTLFKSKKTSRGQGRGAPSSVSIKIYYAAAYPSERFRFFQCPAFDHRKRISEMKISGDQEPFEISIDLATSYPEKSHLIELSPSSFNGGNSLVGEYFIEIAPYDSEKKVIHGNFKRIPRYLEIIAEENVSVKSCSGVHEELRNQN